MASTRILLLSMTVAMAMAAATTEAQSPPSCATKLVPCSGYLNSTAPPAACCDPLKEAMSKELKCMCDILNNKELLTGFGIDPKQAMNLPRHCGIPVSNNPCQDAVHSPRSSASLPPPAAVAGDDGNGGGRIAWTGVSSFILLSTTSLFL